MPAGLPLLERKRRRLPRAFLWMGYSSRSLPVLRGLLQLPSQHTFDRDGFDFRSSAFLFEEAIER
jgi:hypothetical protein